MGYLTLSITSILFMLLYWPLFPSLVKEWINFPDYSHGFLILPVSIYFLWRKREELKNAAIAPSAAGIVIILAGLALHILGKLGFQLFLQYCSMLVVLFGLVYAQGGPAIARQAAFPIAYLIFMIPLPQIVYTTVTFHLSLLSTKLSYLVLKLAGVPAAIEGNIIGLPTCRLVVATPCSGLRSIIVFTAASVAIGYLYQKSLKNRAILFASGLALAVLMNTIRLFVTAYIAYIFKLPEVPMTVHDRTGIAVVIAGFGILYWLSDQLAKKR